MATTTKTLNLATSNLIVRLCGDFRNQDVYVYIVCLKTESCYLRDFKGIVQPKMKMDSPSGHPNCRWVCCIFIWNIFEQKKALQTCCFSVHKMIWWTGVVWIIVVFISCLDSLSDGTHSLQRIHWWASDECYISPNLFWWRNKLIYILDELGVSTFSANLSFCVNYYFIYFHQ